MTKTKATILTVLAGILATGGILGLILVTRPKPALALKQVTWGCIKACGGDVQCIQECGGKGNG